MIEHIKKLKHRQHFPLLSRRFWWHERFFYVGCFSLIFVLILCFVFFTLLFLFFFTFSSCCVVDKSKRRLYCLCRTSMHFTWQPLLCTFLFNCVCGGGEEGGRGRTWAGGGGVVVGRGGRRGGWGGGSVRMLLWVALVEIECALVRLCQRVREKVYVIAHACVCVFNIDCVYSRAIDEKRDVNNMSAIDFWWFTDILLSHYIKPVMTVAPVSLVVCRASPEHEFMDYQAVYALCMNPHVL